MSSILSRSIFVALPACLLADLPSQAQGIYRNGIGARAAAMGGADTGFAEGPLGSMAYNPAGLGSVSGPALDASVIGGVLSGDFTRAGGTGGSLKEQFRFGGEGAFAMPIGKSPLTVGLSVIPEAPLSANWRYPDVDPDGGGPLTAYGGGLPVQQKSEIFVLRSALGLSYKISDKFSVGATLGLIYNDNTLVAPYVFQQTPGLAGLKTLLDLNTDGFGVDGTVGALWKATDTIQVGVSYKAPSTVESHGRATGDLSEQLGNPPGTTPFGYDAEVINHFPQIASAGVSWKATPDWRFTAQVDWIGWRDAFDDLQIHLTKGTAGVPASLNDQVPLRWKDQWVFRGGAEYNLCENWAVRGGYSYAQSPVPDGYLLPLLAAIMEHTIGAGIGWHKGAYSVDAAYQYSIPSSQSVGSSALLSGEYNNSKVEVSAHAFAVTAGVRF